MDLYKLSKMELIETTKLLEKQLADVKFELLELQSLKTKSQTKQKCKKEKELLKEIDTYKRCMSELTIANQELKDKNISLINELEECKKNNLYKCENTKLKKKIKELEATIEQLDFIILSSKKGN